MLRFFLHGVLYGNQQGLRIGCEVESVACTDRYVAKLPDFLLNLTPLRFWMFNAFVVARRIR